MNSVHGTCADPQTMAELNLAAKLKNQLKQEKIQLWNPPYTDLQNQPGQQPMQVSCGGGAAGSAHPHSHLCLCCQELAQRYASALGLQVEAVGGALESIRVQAVNRGKGNKKFRDMNVATLELLLPRDSTKVWTSTLDEYR